MWYRLYFYFLCFLIAVEADIPWDDSQMSTYGEHFKCWGEEEFGQMIGSLAGLLPLKSFVATVRVY